MLKGALLSVILLSCAGVGRVLSNARRRRVELLGELLAAMRVLRLRMLNSLEPLGILMRKSDSRLFRELGNSLWESGGLRECWNDMRKAQMRRGGMLDSLTGEDLGLLDCFFQNLGQSGREEQCALFATVIARMEEEQSAARRRYADASKVYTALGTLIGIAICVLIV